MEKKKYKNIYIDALALIPERKSGIGLTIENTLENLIKINNPANDYNIILVVPLGKAKYLNKYIRKGVSVKTIYMPAKLLQLLLKMNLLLPLDWFLGKGIYIFPNYRNWPLWKSFSITYVYDIGFITFPETVQPKNRKFLSQNIRRWINRTDRIITISEFMKIEIEKYLDVFYQKLAVVYCGVDRKLYYHRNQSEIQKIKNKYNILFDKYLLFVGNIEPRKNLFLLLKAYQKLKENNEFGLVIIGGDGWLNEEVLQEIEKMKTQNYKILKVDKYVTNEDLPAIYSGASALVHPAIYEGFGLTPLEALACKTPVAVSNIPTIKEVVQNLGYYFNPSNVRSITNTISELLNDEKIEKLKPKLGSYLFRWEDSANQLIGVINQLNSEASPRPILKRLKYIYKLIDNKLRSIFGEKILPPYIPREAKSEKELRQILLIDYLNEQPNILQIYSLFIYLKTKHILAFFIKRVILSSTDK